jgi:TonB family protein
MAVVVGTCVEHTKDSRGNKFDKLRLTAVPRQTLQPARDSEPILEVKGEETAVVAKVGGTVSAPTPIYTPQAVYTEDARKRKIEGECFIRLVVDASGFPQNPQVVRSLDSGLDAAALEAVRHYRFNPAVKKGVGPVPVMITVAVNFKLY